MRSPPGKCVLHRAGSRGSSFSNFLALAEPLLCRSVIGWLSACLRLSQPRQLVVSRCKVQRARRKGRRCHKLTKDLGQLQQPTDLKSTTLVSQPRLLILIWPRLVLGKSLILPTKSRILRQRRCSFPCTAPGRGRWYSSGSRSGAHEPSCRPGRGYGAASGRHGDQRRADKPSDW
jgi:hypothetical protein